MSSFIANICKNALSHYLCQEFSSFLIIDIKISRLASSFLGNAFKREFRMLSSWWSLFVIANIEGLNLNSIFNQILQLFFIISCLWNRSFQIGPSVIFCFVGIVQFCVGRCISYQNNLTYFDVFQLLIYMSETYFNSLITPATINLNVFQEILKLFWFRGPLWVFYNSFLAVVISKSYKLNFKGLLWNTSIR